MRKDNYIDEAPDAGDSFARSTKQIGYDIGNTQMGDNDARKLRPQNYTHDYEPIRQQMG